MEELIDLHIHTNYSDGAFSPSEILDLAQKNGVKTIAIADHDTIEAYTTEFLEQAKKKNINVIPAVEISTKTSKIGIHVLGYNININDEKLKKRLSLLRNARHDYLYKVSAKLEKMGYIVQTEELNKIEAVTKAHIANDIISNPENQEILKNEFNHIPTKGEFIETLMNEGCPAYCKKETMTPKEASDLIKTSGGKAVLAHPIAYENEDNLNVEEILEIIKDMNADGIESNYIYINRNNNKINEIKKWNTIAENNNLIATIGSDFHNEDKIHPTIGLKGEDLEIDDQYIKNIIDKLSN